MQRVKRRASNSAVASPSSPLLSTARWSGVFMLLLRLMEPSSWPTLMRNSAIWQKPKWAARCREVLLLSVKSGFWHSRGLLSTMRFTSERSFKWMARRRRTDASILFDYHYPVRLSRTIGSLHIVSNTWTGLRGMLSSCGCDAFKTIGKGLRKTRKRLMT